ncbi:MAG: hypothetical protein JNM43_20120 [Planctomycetaceae bacterium]|nr:hypothetical protein [Planctomycetaceae bacterium]
MSWENLDAEGKPLQAVLMEVTQSVGSAFMQAVGRYGYHVEAPRFGTNPNDPISCYVEWWLEIPAPYELMSCELQLLATADGPEVSARIAVWRYLGKGISLDVDVWRSADVIVESPSAAAAELQRVGAELVRQCKLLDLATYLGASSALPESSVESED